MLEEFGHELLQEERQKGVQTGLFVSTQGVFAKQWRIREHVLKRPKWRAEHLWLFYIIFFASLLREFDWW